MDLRGQSVELSIFIAVVVAKNNDRSSSKRENN